MRPVTESKSFDSRKGLIRNNSVILKNGLEAFRPVTESKSPASPKRLRAGRFGSLNTFRPVTQSKPFHSLEAFRPNHKHYQIPSARCYFMNLWPAPLRTGVRVAIDVITICIAVI